MQALFAHDVTVLSLLYETIADALTVSTVSVGIAGTAFIVFVGAALITTYIDVHLLNKAILKKYALQTQAAILHV